MKFPFSGVVTPNSLTFTAPTGKTFNVTSTNPSFKEMVQVVRQIQDAKRTGQVVLRDSLHDKLTELASPATKLITAGAGSITVSDGVVSYKGTPIHNAITDRILWGISEGFDVKPYALFLTNLMENPSKRSVDELYGFIEKHKMGITDDGYIIAYKKVKGNYHDIYSGKFDHSVGKTLEMARNAVDDDKDRTCSYGFHFCAFSYLPHFGASSGDRVVIVKVNPRDVVSIPADYNDAKARTCKYEVIGEYEGSDLQDVLGKRPVWSSDDFTNFASFADNGYDEEYEDEYADPDDTDDEFARDEDIEALRYVYDKNGDVEEVEVTWADGYVTTAYSQDEFDTVSEILEDQSARGVIARVRVVSNNRVLTSRS